MHLLRRITVLALVWSIAAGWIVVDRLGAAVAEADAYPDIAANLELMQGHLLVSLENYKLGQTPLAQAHATHPLHEHYGKLPLAFAKDHADLDKMVQDTLARLAQSLGEKVDIMIYTVQVQDTARLLEQVGMILIPTEIRQAPAFQAAVLMHLLHEVAEEYAGAVKDGKVVNLPEYQDAFGFLQRAGGFREPVAAPMKGEKRQLLEALWRALEEAIPSIMPPLSPQNAQAVEGHVSAVVALLQGG